MRRLLTLGAATLLLAGCGGTPRVQQAVENCGPLSYIDLGDQGNSVSMDSKGEEDSGGAGIDVIVCVLAGLDMPDSVASRMDQTRALDGMQDADWDGLHASWSYHPDSGVQIIVEDRDAMS